MLSMCVYVSTYACKCIELIWFIKLDFQIHLWGWRTSGSIF